VKKFLNFDIQKNVLKAYKPLWELKFPNYFLGGGRLSLKSSAIAIFCVFFMTWRNIHNKPCNIIAIRRIEKEARRSVRNKIIWALRLFGVIHQYKYSTSETGTLEIRHIRTSNTFYFSGNKNPEEAKGLEIPDTCVVWFEEIENYNSWAEIDVAIKTTVRLHSTDLERVTYLFSYNFPPDPENWVNKLPEMRDTERNLFIRTTYQDDHLGLLSSGILAEIESDKKTDYAMYRHIYHGDPITDADAFMGQLQEHDKLDGKLINFYIGLDSAYKGKDDIIATVLGETQKGHLYLEEQVRIKKDNPWVDGESDLKVIAQVIELIEKYNAKVISIDVSYGVYISQPIARYAKGKNIVVVPINFGAKADDGSIPETSNTIKNIIHNAKNKRASMYMMLRGHIIHNAIFVKKQYKGELQRQLNATTILKRDNQKMQLIPKEHIKKILGKSPDEADSLVLAVNSAKVRTKKRFISYYND